MHKRSFFLLLSLCLLTACGASGGAPSPTPSAPTRAPVVASPPPQQPPPIQRPFNTPVSGPTLALTPSGVSRGCCPLLVEPLAGQLVYSNGDGDIYTTEVRPNAPQKKVLSPLNGKGFFGEPLWSPDGQRILYTFLRPFDSTGLPTVETLTANADGSNPATLLGPQVSGEVFSAPAYSPDGRYVFFAHTRPIFNSKNQVISATLKLERYDTQTRQFKFIADDALQPDVSPDGKRIVYIKQNSETFEQNLWTTNLEGEDAEPVLAKNFTIAVHSPRWSRDSQRILFAAPNLFAKRDAPPKDVVAWVQSWFAVKVAEAHGPPWDFWIVDRTGQNLKKLTEIGEDEPYATWSPDGRQFAFMGLAGLYILDADGKNAKWLFRNGGRGRIDWKK